MQWVLQRDQVAAAIVGVSRSDRIAGYRQTLALQLDGDDLATIDAVLRRRLGPHGDVFGLERDPDGPHGAIMRYNLNRGS